MVDVREVRGRLALRDDYEVPAKEFRALPHLDRLKASAVIDDRENDARFALFEDVARGQGFNLRVCSEPAVAIRWLDEQR